VLDRFETPDDLVRVDIGAVEHGDAALIRRTGFIPASASTVADCGGMSPG
jgi:hypothetical protein